MGLGSLGKIVGIANPALGTAIGTVAGFADRSEQRHSAKTQYKYNSWLQGQNEEFQKYMASNAHQIEVEDLKNAGLNPVASVMNGTAGAIAGSSSTQSTSNGNMPTNFANSLERIQGLMSTQSAIDLNKSQEQLNNATTTKTENESDVIKPKAQAKIKNLHTNSAVNNAKVDEIKSKIELNSALTQYNRERARGKSVNVGVSGKAGSKLLGEIQGAVNAGVTW